MGLSRRGLFGGAAGAALVSPLVSPPIGAVLSSPTAIAAPVGVSPLAAAWQHDFAAAPASMDRLLAELAAQRADVERSCAVLRRCVDAFVRPAGDGGARAMEG